MRFPWDPTQPLRVEVALNTATAAPAWRDVSALVKGNAGVHITRGGGRRHKDVPPGDCSFTLDNTAGTFSDVSGMSLSLYRKRVRVSYRTPGIDGNLLTANQASMETDVSDWFSNTAFGTLTTAAISSSTTHPNSGAKGGLITWPTTGIGSMAMTNASGLVIGRQYTASAYVWVPTGSPNVSMNVLFLTGGTATAVKNGLVRISVTFVATQNTHVIGVRCSSATSGQQCWYDDVQVDEGPTARPFTTTPPPISYRFTGRIATNDLTFPALGRALTALVATDESAWQGSTFSKLRSVPVQEILSDSPAGLWSLAGGDLGDSSGAGGDSMVVTGTGNAPIVDQDPIAASTTANGTTFVGGQYMTAALAAQAGGYLSSGVTLEAAVRTVAATEGTVITASGNFGPSLVLTIGADGKPRARTWNVFTPGAYTANVVSTVAVNDGQPHHVAARYAIATGTLTLFVDGVVVASVVSTAGSGQIEAISNKVTAGGSTHTPAFNGLIAHAALTDGAVADARIADHAAALLNAFRGETVASRLARYNRWAGNAFGTITAVSTVATVGHFDTDGKSIADAIAAVSSVEDGLIFVAGDGTLVARGRATLLNATPSYTVPGPTAGQAARIRNTLKYSTNPLSGIVNDLTGTMPGGVTQHVINSASQDEWGHAEDSVDGPFIDEVALASVIEWRVNTEATPQPTPDGLSVRMSQLDDAVTTTLLGVDLGSVIAWTNMPGQAPAATDTGVVLGIEETYTPEDLLWTVTLAPNPGAQVLIADDPVRGLADSGFIAAY